MSEETSISFRVFPPDGHRFAGDAFVGMIGHRISLAGHHSAWLRMVEVATDGEYAELTVDTSPQPAFSGAGFGTFR